MRRHIVLNALILLPILGCGEAQESAVKSAKRSWVSAPGDAAKSEAPGIPQCQWEGLCIVRYDGRHGGGDGHDAFMRRSIPPRCHAR